jgi:hypothetical protein
MRVGLSDGRSGRGFPCLGAVEDIQDRLKGRVILDYLFS